MFRSASYINPLSWVKEKLVPAVREKQPQEEVQAGKQQAAEAGKLGVFESAPSSTQQKTISRLKGAAATPSTGYLPRKPFKPKPTSVRMLNFVHSILF